MLYLRCKYHARFVRTCGTGDFRYTQGRDKLSVKQTGHVPATFSFHG